MYYNSNRFRVILILLLFTISIFALEVPMNWQNPILNRHVQTSSISYKSESYNYSSAPIHTTNTVRISYSGSTYSVSSYNRSSASRNTEYSNVLSFLRPGKDWITCPYCNGNGYVEWDGSLYTGWFLANDNSPGVCTNRVGYHDSCDAETYGEIYHHAHYIRCPHCNGTGRLNRDGTTYGTTTRGFTEGTMWTHQYEDLDGDGHCDEHYWHTPIGNVPILFFILLGITYLCFKQKHCIQKVKKYIIKPFIH